MLTAPRSRSGPPAAAAVGLPARAPHTSEGRTDGRTLARRDRPGPTPSRPGWLRRRAPQAALFRGNFPAGGRTCALLPPPPAPAPAPAPARPRPPVGPARRGAERSAAAGGWGGPRPLTPGPGRRRRGSVGGRCGEKPPPPQREGAGPPAPSLPFAAGRSKRNKKRNAVCWSPPTPGHSSGT